MPDDFFQSLVGLRNVCEIQPCGLRPMKMLHCWLILKPHGSWLSPTNRSALVLSLVGAMQFFCPRPRFGLINPFCLLFVITLVEAYSLRLVCKSHLNIKHFAVVFTMAFQQEEFWKDLQVINHL